MKIPSTTFYCDVSKCSMSITVPHGEDEQVSAYLSLAEAGWRVKRPFFDGWKHFCAEHHDGGES